MRPLFDLWTSRGLALTAFAIASCLQPPSIGAQDQFVVDHLTIEDGLPVNHANGLLLSRDGYLWVATFGGLVRFDGNRFRTFSAGNTAGVPSDRIVQVIPGPGRDFWFMTEQMDLVQVSPGQFRHVGRFDTQIVSVLPESDSLVWVGTVDGLFRYEMSEANPEGRLERVSDSLLDGRVGSIFRDRSGTLWIYESLESRIFFETPRGWRLAGVLETDYSGDASFFEDRSGNLWAGGSQLSLVRRDSVEPVRIAGLPANAPNFRIVAITERPGADLLLITSFGAYRVRDGRATLVLDSGITGRDPTENHVAAFALCSDGRLWTHRGRVVFSDGQAVSLVPFTMRQFACDAEGNLWVASQGGLYRFRKAEVTTYGLPEGLSVANVTNIYQDSAGGLLISGQQNSYDRVYDDLVTTYFHESGGGSPFYEDSQGNLWHGSDRCLASNRRPDGSCTVFEHRGPYPSPLWVRAMHEDRQGTLWVGTISQLFSRRGDEWSLPLQNHPAAGQASVRYILEARDGTLYFATLGAGVARRVPAHMGGDTDFDFVDMSNGLSSNNVRGLAEDVDGTIWIATEDRGLNHLDPATGAVKVIRQVDGLYTDGLHQILADDYGRFWMSSNQGIFYVRAAELRAFVRGEVRRLTSIFYRERDGMRIREANGGWQNSALKSRDGRLWFATQAGVAVIDPSKVDQHPVPAPLLVEALETADESYWLAGQDHISLAARERTFRVVYTAINFTTPSRMRFRHRLRGYDDAWSEAADRREAAYTRVPAGRYEFQVEASRGDGVWTAEPTSLSLTVAPFFYETLAFKGLAILGVFGLLALLSQARTRALTRKRRELEAEVRERTEALRREKQLTEEQGHKLIQLDRTKSQFFTNVSHEFRTPLTLTIGPLEDLQADPALPPKLRDGVDTALTNSRRILRLINQLLDVARLEAGEMRLTASRQDLGVFVAGVAQQFSKLLERKGIHFEVIVPPGPVTAYFDPEKLEQVIVNLLSNAFKFTPQGGAVHVALSVDSDASPGAARIVVRDTGPGMNAEMLPHVFDRFYQIAEAGTALHGTSGIGLSLAKDLIELHGGSIAVESTLRFGSTFTVTLLLGRDHLSDDQVVSAASSVCTAGKIAGIAVETEIEAAGIPDEAPEMDERFTILVADDNAEIRTYVRGHLEDHFRVLEAGDGKEALGIIRESTPDLVVSDIMMPEMDGLTLLATMRANRETDFIPVILLTARATEDDLVRGLELGADAYLTKPFSVRELNVRIESLIDSRLRLRRRFADSQLEAARPSTPLVAAGGISSVDAAFLAKLNTVIGENLSDEDFDIQKMADAMRISRNTVHRRLKPLLSLTPTEYLRQARLERAASLLAANEWTVSEVAYAVGFKSVSYFSHCFRQRYDTTPSDYRWRHAPGTAAPSELT